MVTKHKKGIMDGAQYSYSITMRSIALLIVTICVASTQGFVAVIPPSVKKSKTTLSMTVLSYNGKKKDFKAGSPLSRAVAQLGVPVKYSCKKYVLVSVVTLF